MAVVAVVGVGAVIGGAISGYSDHSDYSDYYAHSDYSNYSDAAERRRRRIEAKNKEIETQKYEINAYKTEHVNGYLQTLVLKRQDGLSVSVPEVKKDGDMKIVNEENIDIGRESAGLKSEVAELDSLLGKIKTVLEESE